MAKYLDKTGLSYLWGKVKEKLNKKADNDKYKIATFTTQKITYSATRLDKLERAVYLTDVSKNNFSETFPSGYHIACILTVRARYFNEDGNMIETPRPCEIWPLRLRPSQFLNAGDVQVWSVNLGEYAPMSTGEWHTLTLLLEKN